MKVAFATEDLQHVNAHFGWARHIAIYEVTAKNSELLQVAEFDGDLQEDGNEDKLAPKLDIIADCAILCVAAIGGSGAARVVAKNIHPIRVPGTETIYQQITKLQTVLAGTPPPWLRKALNKGVERSFDFENEVAHG